MRFLLPLLLLACAACDSASPITVPGETTVDGVTFRVDRTQVQRGGTVELALVNESDRVLYAGVLGCAVVERKRGAEWDVLDADNPGGCILPLYGFRPGETYEEPRRLDVAPGTVRFKHDVQLEGRAWQPIRSPTIRVVR